MNKDGNLTFGGEIAKTLKNRNEQYYNNALVFINNRANDYATIQKGKSFFTSHSYFHLANVEKYVYMLLGEKNIKHLTDVELYLLLCAIYLHDIGMAITGKRKDHAKESEKIIVAKEEEFIRTQYATIIGKIVLSHGEDNLSALVDTTLTEMGHMSKCKGIKVGSLMALLRMGDLLDCTKTRTSSEMQEGRKKDIVGTSVKHWVENSWIDEIDCDESQNTIFISATPKGPYSSRILIEKKRYFEKQLSINEKYLNDIGVNYHYFQWDLSTQKLINKYTKKEDSEKYLKPFIEFDTSSYLYLHGRDKDEDGLINSILVGKENKKATILLGPSRIGKTALVNGRIEQAFSEMGFSVEKHDYIGGEYAFSYSNSCGERRLYIIDQTERIFTGDYSTNHTLLFSELNKLIEDDPLFYVLIVIRKDYYKKLHHILKDAYINEELYSLESTLGINVICSLLDENSIPYDIEILKRIDVYLSIENKNDLSTLQIVISSMIEKNRQLLVDSALIAEDYNDVQNMTDVLIDEYYNHTFSGLNDLKKQLLIAACNTNNDGTVRAKTKGYDSEKKELQKRGIITVLEDGNYEFIHDLLAEHFCNILDDEEKQLLNLRNSIIAGDPSPDDLQKIQKHKEKLVDINHFTNRSIGKLIYYYSSENNYEQMEYWMSKYPNAATLLAVIDSFVDGLKDRISIASLSNYLRIYNDCVSRCVKLLPMNEKNQFVDEITALHNSNNSYLLFCAIDVLDCLPKKRRENGRFYKIPDKKLHDGIILAEQYKEIFQEIYYLLDNHNILDSLVTTYQLPEFWMNRVRLLFEEGLEGAFYKTLNYSKAINETKYCDMISILLILLDSVNNIESVRIVKGRVELIYGNEYRLIPDDGSGIIVWENQGGAEKLFKFVYNEFIEVAFVKNLDNDSLTPIAYLKYVSQKSFSLFRKRDIATLVRKYEIFYDATSDNNTFTDGMAKLITKPFRWETIVSSIEELCSSDGTPLDGLLNSIFPSYVPYSSPLYKLALCLCCLTYVNLRKKKKDRFERARIHLIKNDIREDAFNLYDRLYIELYKYNSEDTRTIYIDPYHVRGVARSNDEYVEFVLPNSTRTNSGHSWSISHEVQYFDNASDSIIILIGDKYGNILSKYKTAFSYALFWDDKINQVSKAVDEWEYELNKLFMVLKTNNYISDIFVLGNVNNCPKAVGYLLTFCKYSTPAAQFDYLKLEESEYSSNTQYVFADGVTLLKNTNLHIIHSESNVSKSLAEAINLHYLNNHDRIIRKNIKSLDQNNNSTDKDEQIIQKYAAKKGLQKEYNYINAETLDDAYKQSLAMLIAFGETNSDSYKKKIRELKGFTLSIPKVYLTGYSMSYRRSEIDSYFNSQWINEEGEIYKSIHANQELNVNQLDIIVDGIVNTMMHEKGSRKLMFSFYKPTPEIITNFEMPSLLECLLYIRYEGNDIFIDSVFTWRTNECILGLPMSLESSIRWLAEVIIPEIKKRLSLSEEKDIKLGNYKYIGINMHCFDNSITKSMIARVIT